MSKEIWSNVIEKCEKKLARWKGQYLSLRGIRRKFLRHGNKDRKGYNLVKWNDLIIEKRYEGLGIKNL